MAATAGASRARKSSKHWNIATRSTVIEAGAFYPVVRSRERNLTLTGLVFMSDNYSDILRAPFNVDRLRGFRGKADADIADSLQGINQFNVTFSQGIEGLGSTDNGNPLASRAAGRVDFSKIEGTVSRTQPLPGAVLRLRQPVRPICLHAAAVVRAMRLWRPVLRPRIRSVRDARR